MNKWSKEEEKLLKDNYNLMKINDLLHLFQNRTLLSIKAKIFKLNLKKLRNNRCESDCSILLKDLPISYYWIGFIMADGNISKDYRLQINISNKDKSHLIKFANYIKCNNVHDIKKSQTRLACRDYLFIKQIKEKFDIRNDKTYYPPKLEIDDDNLFIAFLAGFIDGDGNIQLTKKDCSLNIHIHSSWLNNLVYIKNRIENIYNVKLNEPKIGKDGYSLFTTGNLELLKAIKKDVIKLNLPFLERKWNKIDLNRVTKIEKFNRDCEQIQIMFLNGMKCKDIALKLNRSYSITLRVINKYIKPKMKECISNVF